MCCRLLFLQLFPALGVPKCSQNGPRWLPKYTQNGPQNDLWGLLGPPGVPHWILGSILGAFWAPFWAPWGSQNREKTAFLAKKVIPRAIFNEFPANAGFLHFFGRFLVEFWRSRPLRKHIYIRFRKVFDFSEKLLKKAKGDPKMEPKSIDCWEKITKNRQN